MLRHRSEGCMVWGQAACLLSKKGEALFISFSPSLSAERVVLPPGATFVIANSMTAARKVNAQHSLRLGAGLPLVLESWAG